jgi:F-type H+-transporting ATPase subunit a
MTAAETEAVHGAGEQAAGQAAEHGAGGFDAGGMIMHHILDAKEFEVPWTGGQVILPLPEFHLFGLDLSVTRAVLMMWIASAFLIVLFWRAARTAGDPVPRGLRGALEVLILFIRDEIGKKCIGKGHERYTGYLLTTFFFILTCNLLGLVPGMSTATAAISVTAGLAIMAFLMIQLAGIRNYGVLGHFKNLVPHGLPPAILPIMIPVEILGMFTKPFALCVRLFANMTAGHVVILSLIGLIFILEHVAVAAVAVPFALFIYVLELLVAFIQAFIFTLLTGLFIGMSAHPAH